MHLKTRPRRHLTTITRRCVWVCACVFVGGVGGCTPLANRYSYSKRLAQTSRSCAVPLRTRACPQFVSAFFVLNVIRIFCARGEPPAHTQSEECWPSTKWLPSSQSQQCLSGCCMRACEWVNEWAWVCACVGAQLSCSLVRVVVCSLAPTLCRFWLCLSILSLSTYLFVLDIYYCKVLKSYTSKACYNCRSSMRSDDPISSGAWVQIFAHLTL